MDQSELAYVWGLRLVRGLLLATIAFSLAMAQLYVSFPVWWLCVAFVLLSLVDGLMPYAKLGIGALLALAVLPPQLFVSLGNWITALVR